MVHIMKGRPLPPRHQIEPDTPLRLAVAAALEFPDGSMTASGLRREAAHGRLQIWRIAGKDYTTIAGLTEMRGKRVRSSHHDSDSAPPEKGAERSGSSRTRNAKSAQALAKA